MSDPTCDTTLLLEDGLYGEPWALKQRIARCDREIEREQRTIDDAHVRMAKLVANRDNYRERLARLHAEAGALNAGD